MKLSVNAPQSLISVIIPCYNQGRYLEKAIESVVSQTYNQYEIVVVDDGSTDNTKSIAGCYPFVKYVYQSNQGLAAARNKGIDCSTGDFLVFLDSDDWLLPDALQINLKFLLQNPELAFVSGAHTFFYEKDNKNREVRREVVKDNYLYLLEGNFIAMIASVLFHRWIFDSIRYDTSLKTCEDYDLYLKITRLYPVKQHTLMIAIYRIHNKNLSGNATIMLENSLLVLNRQKNLLLNKEEKKAFKNGHLFWKSYYSKLIYADLSLKFKNNRFTNKSEMMILKSAKRSLYFKLIRENNLYVWGRMFNNLKLYLRKRPLISIIKKIFRFKTPQLNKINMGDFKRVTPFSDQFGYDRGGPIDRYYIESFLEINSYLIKGNVLEIGDNEYTLRFGASKVTKSDILHIDHKNAKATIIGDLSNAPQIADNSFDCIILTQTLQLIYGYKEAIETCYRILKPGGILLITVPGISNIAHDAWGKYFNWSFTDNSVKRILSESFETDKIRIDTFGNVMVASAFLYGMGVSEISKVNLDFMDPHYQLIITASAIKRD